MKEQKNEINLSNAKGKIEYTFLNDYMFRAILQKNKPVLKSLVAACMYKEVDEIIDVEITNPIELGNAIDQKTFILDVNVLLNHNTSINLEMQVLYMKDWPERSLSYLCRCYDNLCKGEGYEQAKPAYHIGFLDFDLFPEYSEFFSKYRMMNIKNHHLFTSKFNLFVVNLNQIESAVDEDYESGLVYWTKMFKAKTWEEIKMLVEKNPELLDASEALYELNQDEIIRQQCRAREDYYAHERYVKEKMQKLQECLEEQNSQIEEQKGQIEEQKGQIEEQKGQIEEQKGQIEEQKGQIEEQKNQLEELELQKQLVVKRIAELHSISLEEAYQMLYS